MLKLAKAIKFPAIQCCPLKAYTFSSRAKCKTSFVNAVDPHQICLLAESVNMKVMFLSGSDLGDLHALPFIAISLNLVRLWTL